jgi:N6-adenosine-specific RNA methylase IME4
MTGESTRPGWDFWGNQTDKFNADDDARRSYDLAIASMREIKVRAGKCVPLSATEARWAAEGEVEQAALETLRGLPVHDLPQGLEGTMFEEPPT